LKVIIVKIKKLKEESRVSSIHDEEEKDENDLLEMKGHEITQQQQQLPPPTTTATTMKVLCDVSTVYTYI